jgi:hypothetical protein
LIIIELSFVGFLYVFKLRDLTEFAVEMAEAKSPRSNLVPDVLHPFRPGRAPEPEPRTGAMSLLQVDASEVVSKKARKDRTWTGAGKDEGRPD